MVSFFLPSHAHENSHTKAITSAAPGSLFLKVALRGHLRESLSQPLHPLLSYTPSVANYSFLLDCVAGRKTGGLENKQDNLWHA